MKTSIDGAPLRDGDLVIRHARPEDFDAYLELRRDPVNILWSGHAGPPDPNRLRKWYDERLAEANFSFLLGEEHGEVIGYSYSRVFDHLIDTAIGVHSGRSGKGYGRRMIRAVAVDLRRIYPDRPIETWVIDENIGSNKAWAAAGYALYAEAPPRIVDVPKLGKKAKMFCWRFQS